MSEIVGPPRAGRFGDGALLAALFVAGVVIGLVPVLIQHRFYLIDDMENQFLPMFYHIGRLLRAGEFPLITLSSWVGSNIAAEFQYAIFNPFSLLLYTILPAIQDYATGAAFVACAYHGVLTAGAGLLARSYGLDRSWSVLAAIAVATNPFLSYWAAANWFPIFVSTAWAVWAWALLRLAPTDRWYWLAAAAASYLVISSGFPQAVIMLGLIGVLVAFEQRRIHASWVPAFGVIGAVITGVLLGAMPLLSLASASQLTTRPSLIGNWDFLTPNLRDLLQFSVATHQGYMNSWSGFSLVATPITYVAWFILPVLVLVDWRRVDWARPAVTSLVLLGVAVLWAMQGPQEFHFFRFFIRWMPYFHIALIMLTCVLVQNAGLVPSRRRVGIALAATAASHFLAIQVYPPLVLHHVASALIAMLGLWWFVRAYRARSQWSVVPLLVFAALFFVGQHWLIRTNGNFSTYNSMDHQVAGADAVSSRVPPGNLMILNPGPPPGPDATGEYRTGLGAVEWGRSIINGYSGIGHRPLYERLCTDWAGQTCPDVGRRLLEVEGETGQRFVDLFRISELIVKRGEHLDQLPTEIGDSSDWRLSFDGVETQRFVRDLASLPGSVAWASPDVTVQGSGEATIRSEVLTVQSPTDAPSKVVFSRLWWPGYRAELNGQPLEVHAASGIFVAVDLPPGANGELRLSYRLPRLFTGLAITALGVLLAIGLMMVHGRLFPRIPGTVRPAPSERPRPSA